MACPCSSAIFFERTHRANAQEGSGWSGQTATAKSRKDAEDGGHDSDQSEKRAGGDGGFLSGVLARLGALTLEFFGLPTCSGKGCEALSASNLAVVWLWL